MRVELVHLLGKYAIQQRYVTDYSHTYSVCIGLRQNSYKSMIVIAKAGHETNQMEKCMLRCVSREYICWRTMQFDRDQSEISTLSSLPASVCDMHSNWHAVSVTFGN
jgi:hypothetical protein